MKTFLLSLILLIITISGFTQIKKGQFLIGGNIHFESIKNDNANTASNESTNYFISPNIGYFIIDKMAGGVRIDFGSYHFKSDTFKTNYITTPISPFLRYYLLPIPNKVNAFIEISYIHKKTKWNSVDNPGYYENQRDMAFPPARLSFLQTKSL